MHELSIVMGIVDIAEEQLKKEQGHHIDQIELDIGTMAGIEFEALDFAWDAGVRNTVLSNAVRQINRIQAKARCLECGSEFQVTEAFQQCPVCEGYLNEFIQGKELRVKSLVLS
ncbi:MAG: hydrogenase maturation nickel metallochaperone HypA [Bacteroidota bacterium]